MVAHVLFESKTSYTSQLFPVCYTLYLNVAFHSLIFSRGRILRPIASFRDRRSEGCRVVLDCLLLQQHQSS